MERKVSMNSTQAVNQLVITRPAMLKALQTCGAKDNTNNLNVAFHICTSITMGNTLEQSLLQKNHIDDSPRITKAFSEQIYSLIQNQ
jgi:hypothetical protein